MNFESFEQFISCLCCISSVAIMALFGFGYLRYLIMEQKRVKNVERKIAKIENKLNENGTLLLPVRINCENCGKEIVLQSPSFSCDCKCEYQIVGSGINWKASHGFDGRWGEIKTCNRCSNILAFHTRISLNARKEYCSKCGYSKYESDD
jgi:ribosomal protein S27AE